MRKNLIRPLILGRELSVSFFELSGKIGYILVTNRIGNFFNSEIGFVFNVFTSFIQPNGTDILNGSESGCQF